MPDAPVMLKPWSDFYVIVGSSAAALTGLMFVVITLMNRRPTPQADDGIATFSTPTVLHFCSALLVASVVVAPWRSLLAPAVLLGMCGLYGLIHIVRVVSRARRLSTYRPDAEDWITYTILPFIGYGAIFGGAAAFLRLPIDGLFAVAGGTLLLIFIGIRNSWDIVTYIVAGKMESDAGAQGAGAPPEDEG